MKYETAPDLIERLEDLVKTLNLDYIDTKKLACFRSYGTNSRRVIARCHGLPKVMQLGLNTEPFYVIEVIGERFDKMNYEEQTKVLIHELLHIPKTFGGGFRQHNFVNRRMVENVYNQYKKIKENETTITPTHTEEEKKEKKESIKIIEQLFQSFTMNKKE